MDPVRAGCLSHAVEVVQVVVGLLPERLLLLDCFQVKSLSTLMRSKICLCRRKNQHQFVTTFVQLSHVAEIELLSCLQSLLNVQFHLSGVS